MKKLLLATAAAVLLACPAFANTCIPGEQALIHLENAGQELVASGFDPKGAILEWYANPETGMWSLVGLLPDGTRCLLASGGGFQRMSFKPNV